jgi:uncharacterized protein (TIGR01777 family)
MGMRIFIAGGTGQIGSRLLPVLKERGDQVVLLTRGAAKARQRFGDGYEYVEGNPAKPGLWQDAVSGCQAVVNLVGESLFAKRWNDDFKKVLRDSRLQSTTNIATAIQNARERPSVLVQGTAVGYYGFRGEEELTEESAPGSDFLAKLCIDWENTALPVERAGVRLVLLRTGVVLDSQGGALKMMLTPFKLVLFGGPVGSGQQWTPWIHWADENGLILFALDNPQVRGPLNATAPEPARNKPAMQAIGAAMNRPSFCPTPGFMLWAGLGEVAAVVLESVRAVPKKALALGYQFKFPEIGGAMKDLLKK